MFARLCLVFDEQMVEYGQESMTFALYTTSWSGLSALMYLFLTTMNELALMEMLLNDRTMRSVLHEARTRILTTYFCIQENACEGLREHGLGAHAALVLLSFDKNCYTHQLNNLRATRAAYTCSVFYLREWVW